MQAAHSPIYFLTLLFFYFFIFFPAWGWRGLEHHPLTPILFYFLSPSGKGSPAAAREGRGRLPAVPQPRAFPRPQLKMGSGQRVERGSGTCGSPFPAQHPRPGLPFPPGCCPRNGGRGWELFDISARTARLSFSSAQISCFEI